MRERRDPLAGARRLIVDGTNFLHALGRGPGAAPPATLVGRLRAVVPAGIAIDLVFDGPPDGGPAGRIASGVTVRFANRSSADALIDRLVVDAGWAAAVGPAAGAAERETRATEAIVVVTDDIALGAAVRRRGARTVGTRWLAGRLAATRLAAPTVARSRPPAPSPSAAREAAARDEDAAAERGWRPGRGATAKRGNPRRAGKSGTSGRGRGPRGGPPR